MLFGRSTPRLAGIYKFQRDYVVASFAGAKGYPQVEVDWAALPLTADARELGTATTKALSRYRVCKLGSTSGSHVRNIEQCTGIAKHNLSIGKALQVSVETDGTDFDVVPLRNGGVSGSDRGFHEVSDAKVALQKPSDIELGNAILNAFEKSIVQKNWANN